MFIIFGMTIITEFVIMNATIPVCYNVLYVHNKTSQLLFTHFAMASLILLLILNLYFCLQD